jgi:hypothetical protein
VRRELLDMRLAEDGTYTDPATRCGAKRSLRTSLAAPSAGRPTMELELERS